VAEKVAIGNAELWHGECLDVLRTLPDCSVDSIVSDPPYGLTFMGKRWDYDVPSVEIWAECLRVLKPGGHLLAFAGTRTQHRMAVRIEDAGFEIRDLIAWVYGSGFPKSLDVSKAIDKLDAAEARQARRFKFTEWMRSTGLTAKRIDDLTGTCMGHHYTTHPTQPAIATREHLEALRDYIPFEVPDWVEALVDERTVESENFKRREVVGVAEMRDTSEVRIAVTASADDYDATARREVAITAPATDAARQWQGWGTALKPALEPITVARKPLTGTVAANVLEHGTGALNVDGCRIPVEDDQYARNCSGNRGHDQNRARSMDFAMTAGSANALGRWPSNLIHDGSEEVVGLFPAQAGAAAPVHRRNSDKFRQTYGSFAGNIDEAGSTFHGDTGSAARFFYCAKASRADREDGVQHRDKKPLLWSSGSQNPGSFQSPNTDRSASNHHPTVKPTDLMRYLCRLVTPPGGVVLDPFMGSGSTGKAAMLEGFRFVGIEREAEYVEIAKARIARAQAQGQLLSPQEPRECVQEVLL
jgi:DNA modification methylase